MHITGDHVLIDTGIPFDNTGELMPSKR